MVSLHGVHHHFVYQRKMTNPADSLQISGKSTKPLCDILGLFHIPHISDMIENICSKHHALVHPSIRVDRCDPTIATDSRYNKNTSLDRDGGHGIVPPKSTCSTCIMYDVVKL
jgi:hypothetical protein